MQHKFELLFVLAAVSVESHCAATHGQTPHATSDAASDPLDDVVSLGPAAPGYAEVTAQLETDGVYDAVALPAENCLGSNTRCAVPRALRGSLCRGLEPRGSDGQRPKSARTSRPYTSTPHTCAARSSAAPMASSDGLAPLPWALRALVHGSDWENARGARRCVGVTPSVESLLAFRLAEQHLGQARQARVWFSRARTLARASGLDIALSSLTIESPMAVAWPDADWLVLGRYAERMDSQGYRAAERLTWGLDFRWAKTGTFWSGWETEGPVHPLAVSPDGTQLAVVRGGVLELRDRHTGAPGAALQGATNIQNLAWSRDGSFLAAGITKATSSSGAPRVNCSRPSISTARRSQNVVSTAWILTIPRTTPRSRYRSRRTPCSWR